MITLGISLYGLLGTSGTLGEKILATATLLHDWYSILLVLSITAAILVLFSTYMIRRYCIKNDVRLLEPGQALLANITIIAVNVIIVYQLWMLNFVIQETPKALEDIRHLSALGIMSIISFYGMFFLSFFRDIKLRYV